MVDGDLESTAMRLESVREVKAQLAAPGPQAQDAGGAGLAGVALGARPVDGGEYRLAVRVQDREAMRGPLIGRIEAAARGEVDVRYVGRVVKRDAPFFQARRRPLVIGASVSHFAVTAGTLGAFVRTSDGGLHLLSNNHVLADENRGRAGDAILQPGTADGGRDPQDRIASLASFVELAENRANAVDAALARIAEGIDIDAGTLLDAGSLAGGALAPSEATEVEKVGRTTGHTVGRVTAFELDGVEVAYDAFPALRFDDQVEVEGTGPGPFSQGGDSGSLIFSADGLQAVALLFAGGEEGGVDVTYGNPIGAVLEALGGELVTR